MSIRKTILAVAITAAAVPAAFANSGATWVGGELGFQPHAVQSTKTREQVRAEFEAFRRQPVAGDGYMVVQNEIGYVADPSKVAQSTKTREQVRAEFDGFRGHPVTSDGLEVVQNEIGYIPHQHAYEERNGVPGHASNTAQTGNSVQTR